MQELEKRLRGIEKYGYVPHSLRQDVRHAADTLKRYREALEWYAEPLMPYAITQPSEPRSAVHADKGKRARQALEEPKQ